MDRLRWSTERLPDVCLTQRRTVKGRRWRQGCEFKQSRRVDRGLSAGRKEEVDTARYISSGLLQKKSREKMKETTRKKVVISYSEASIEHAK